MRPSGARRAAERAEVARDTENHWMPNETVYFSVVFKRSAAPKLFQLPINVMTTTVVIVGLQRGVRISHSG